MCGRLRAARSPRRGRAGGSERRAGCRWRDRGPKASDPCLDAPASPPRLRRARAAAAQTENPLSPSKNSVARAEKARLRDLKKKQEEELERVREMQNQAVGTDGVRGPAITKNMCCTPVASASATQRDARCLASPAARHVGEPPRLLCSCTSASPSRAASPDAALPCPPACRRKGKTCSSTCSRRRRFSPTFCLAAPVRATSPTRKSAPPPWPRPLPCYPADPPAGRTFRLTFRPPAQRQAQEGGWPRNDGGRGEARDRG